MKSPISDGASVIDTTPFFNRSEAETITLPVMREYACDVLVVGGGPAGISAAVCSARHGARTILAERNGFLGGMATAGMVGPFMTSTTPDGGLQLIRGFFDEFVRAMEAKGGAIHPTKAKYGSFSSYRNGGHRGLTTFDPEVLKSVAEEKCRTAGVGLLYHLLFLKVDVADGKVSAAYFATKDGIWKIKAKVFIDCTGDGDVVHSAGVPTIFGDGEGGVQASSLFFSVKGVDRSKMDAHDADCRARGDNDGRFYMREIEAARTAGEFPIWRQKVQLFEQLDGTWLVNMGQVDGVDARDPRQVTDAEIEGREQARIIVAFLRKHVDGCENCELAHTASQLGVRETRRIVGEYTLTLDDVGNSKHFDDSVFCCANHIDIHGKDGIEYVVRKTDAPYFIPYRSLLPKGVNNMLVAGRCLSAERPVVGAIRVMPPCFAMGQAAGTAAALSADFEWQPKNIDIAGLVATLVADGAYIP